MRNNNRLYELSFDHCRNIVKKSGSSFYYGMWLTLNKDKRNALFVIYAWMRNIDDVADGSLAKEEKIKQLKEFFHRTELICHAFTVNEASSFDFYRHDSLWPAFHQTLLTYNLSSSYFRDMFTGQLQSIQQSRYDTFLELYQYCYRVASSVGLICVSIWGYEGGASTLKMAEYRGVALQLINVARDICSDVTSGTLFVPAEWINGEREHFTKLLFSHDKHSVEIIPTLRKIIDSAEYYYHESIGLERNVSRTGSLSLRVMTSTYWALLKKIKKNPELLLQPKKIKLNRFEKIRVCFLGFIQWCWDI